MSKSDDVSHWYRKPELFKRIIHFVKLFLLTFQWSVSDLRSSTDDGINPDNDLDSIDYPHCETEKIKNTLFVLT